MITAAEVLRAIEVAAELATVQELRLMARHTKHLLPALDVEDQVHADALMRKMRRLMRDRRIRRRPHAGPWDTETRLLQHVRACADALLEGLSGWLRGDVHPDAMPGPLMPFLGAAVGAAYTDSMMDVPDTPLDRLASLAAAAISRAAGGTGPAVVAMPAPLLRR
jgi:hypothetical protein